MKQPNILMIVCDQLRYDCLGFSGKNPVKTPNLDSLAADSLYFDNAYTSLPTCCPARQSLLVGKRAETFGALWNYDITSQIASLTPEHHNWPQAMRTAGYRMAYVGKWHVSPKFDPTDFGYESYYSNDAYQRFRTENHPDAVCPFDWFGSVDPIPTVSSHTHVLAQKAIEKINEFAGSDTPWHVRLDFDEPHLPCCPCAEFANLYCPEDMVEWPSFADTFTNKPYIQQQNILSWNNENRTWKDWAQYVARYFGIITQTDDAIGKVLDALRASGAWDNTVILFTADHGDMCGSHRMMDKHYVLYDDVVHIPMLLHAPGAVARRITKFTCNCLDIAPTLLELTGAVPFDTDGLSLVPLLQNQSADYLRDWTVASLNGQQFGLYSQRMLRTAQWKYIWNLTDVDELYDMRNDPWELHNRIADPALQDVISSLRRQLYGILKKEDPDIVKTQWLETQLLENHKINIRS